MPSSSPCACQWYAPVFQPAGPLDPAEVERVHKDIITRIRRVLERHGLNPVALGLPPRPRSGEARAPEQHDSPEYSQPLLDFGEAQDGSFLPGLKAASVQSAAPFGPCHGREINLEERVECAGGGCGELLLGLAELASPVRQGRDGDAALLGELGEGESFGLSAGQEGEVLGWVSSSVVRHAGIIGPIALLIHVGLIRRLPIFTPIVGLNSDSIPASIGLRWRARSSDKDGTS